MAQTSAGRSSGLATREVELEMRQENGPDESYRSSGLDVIVREVGVKDEVGKHPRQVLVACLGWK